MNRRRYLATTGIGVLTAFAGCSSNGGNSDDGQDSGDPNDDQTSSGPDVVLVEDTETTRSYGALGEVRVIDFVLENQGGARSGEVSVTVEWTDSEGNNDGEGFAGVATLGSGVRWNGTAPRQGGSGEEPDDYEISVDVDDELEEQPDISVTESSLETTEEDGEEELVLRATATNDTGEDWDFVSVYVQLLNGQTLLVEAFDSVDNLDAGESWDFEIAFPEQDPGLAGQAEYDFYFNVSNQ